MEVILIAALSADGYLAKDLDVASTVWTSKEDAAWFRQKTKQSGVCIMGKKTFETIGRPLAGRLTMVYSREQNLSVPTEPQVLEITSDEPEILLQKLTDRGFDSVAICGGASIYTLFMQKKLINRLFLTVEPVIFGSGIRLFTQSLDFRLKLVATYALSAQTVVLEYQV